MKNEVYTKNLQKEEIKSLNKLLEENFKKEFKSEKVKVTNRDLNDLLYVSDVVIIRHSTVGLEAMIHLKPLIIYGKKLDNFNLFVKSDATIKARNKKQLKERLKLVLFNEEIRAIMTCKSKLFAEETVANAFTGNATEEALKFIKEIVNEGEKQC